MRSESEVEKVVEELEESTIAQSNRAYGAAMREVLAKHKATLDRVAALEKKGDYASVRRVVRSSGLLNDVAIALAKAGRDSAKAIRAMLESDREAVRSESS